MVTTSSDGSRVESNMGRVSTFILARDLKPDREHEASLGLSLFGRDPPLNLKGRRVQYVRCRIRNNEDYSARKQVPGECVSIRSSAVGVRTQIDQ